MNNENKVVPPDVFQRAVEDRDRKKRKAYPVGDPLRYAGKADPQDVLDELGGRAPPSLED